MHWFNQPATAGPVATTQSGIGFVDWNVLAQTQDMYALGSHGFLIRDAQENGSGEQSFHSREKGDDRPPELLLAFDDPDGTPGPGTCPTNPQNIAADRDSWVAQGSPSNNFGADSTLKVKTQPANNSRALIRFPLPALPSGCTGIASATLQLDAASGKEGRTLEARQVASAWAESTVTWANQPGTTGPAAAVPSAEGPLAWDVTEQLLGMYTSANHGFLIRDAQEDGVGDEQTINSRDKLGDNPPLLVIAFDDSTPETFIERGPESPTTSGEATFSFASDRADATFECSLDGAPFKACSSPHHVGGLSEGDHTFEVRSTRKVRAVDPTPARYAWGIAIPPDTTIDGPASPSSSADATLAFAADDPEATFECSLNGAPFAACVSPVQYANLADGEQVVEVRATDALGNLEPEPASHAWTVAVPPEVTIVRAPADPGNDPAPVFEFTATDNGPAPPVLSFECSVDGVALDDCASVGPLADGAHTFEVVATDAGGSRGSDSHSWTVDTVAPVVTLDVVPGDPSNDASPAFAYSSEPGALVECVIDGLVSCESPDLADGRHTVEVSATDAAGNTGTARYSWTIDTAAPVVTLDVVPGDPSNDSSPAFEYSTEPGARVECAIDGTLGCDSALADGPHIVKVSATDAAGNTGTARYSWTIDTVAPVVTLDVVPPDPSNDSSPAVEYSSEPGALVECVVDGIASCESPELADGRHTIDVKATDAAGNSGSASYSWTIDTAAPVVTLDVVPPDPSNDSSPAVDYSTEPGARVECLIDGTLGCDSELPDGLHTVEVRATDAAGNTGTATYSWTIDTVAPAVTLDSVPPDPSNDATPTFEYTTEAGAIVECRIDGALGCDRGARRRVTHRRGERDRRRRQHRHRHLHWTIDTVAPTVTLDTVPPDPSNDATPTFEHTTEPGATVECTIDGTWGCDSELPDGPHTVEVTATDAAGNTGTATHSWTIDTVAPVVTLDSVPPDPSNDATPEFAYSAEHGAHVECTIDGTESCDAPELADGPHTVEVTATDAAGNVGTASYSWTVDTSAPVVTLDVVPPDPSNDATPTFEYSTEPGASVECTIDGTWGCDSELPDGPHSVEVRATDAAGNTGTASYSWTIDTVAPVVTLDSVPPDPSNDATPEFAYSAEPGAHVECTIDGTLSCDAPELADGPHTVEVRATDAAGNVGTASTAGPSTPVLRS